MPSRPHNGSLAPHATRSGNGGIPASRLMAWMRISADGHAPNDQEAIRILSVHLQLTARQAEVLHWTAEGKTNGEIATILGCSVNTVKLHLKDIFQRLGVHTRSAATGCAYRAHIRHLHQAPHLPGRVIAENQGTH